MTENAFEDQFFLQQSHKLTKIKFDDCYFPGRPNIVLEHL